MTPIENAIAKGDKGILITPNGPGVNSAIKKARDAGLYVIALDTPPDPANTVDITFATDNFKAGELIGQWTAAKLDGKPAAIAMLDLFNDKVVSVDYNRDQGFLTGMGIDAKDKAKNGDEAKTGNYTGGTYTIVCNEPTNGAEDGGRTAMERCLAKNPNINVVYTINEPAGAGAYEALKAAGKTATIVSVDGGCHGRQPGQDGHHRRHRPAVPAEDGRARRRGDREVRQGQAPSRPRHPGLDFFDTGVALVTDKPVAGVDSITSDEGQQDLLGHRPARRARLAGGPAHASAAPPAMPPRHDTRHCRHPSDGTVRTARTLQDRRWRPQ